MFELKPIARDAIARALDKAEQYRLLNEPRAAESICLDVLAIEPDNQQAVTGLLLALTDQFGMRGTGIAEQAKQLVPRLSGEFERAYYAGIISERLARQQLSQDQPGAGFEAFEYLVEAMEHYARAEPLAPDGNDDAILRHNTCVRMIERHQLVARHRDDSEYPLE
jgi:hypothetical protein